jgi:hypothetical protein
MGWSIALAQRLSGLMAWAHSKPVEVQAKLIRETLMDLPAREKVWMAEELLHGTGRKVIRAAKPNPPTRARAKAEGLCPTPSPAAPRT